MSAVLLLIKSARIPYTSPKATRSAAAEIGCLGLATVALRARVAQRRAAQEPELRVDTRAGVADGEVKPQRDALRETELPVEPLGNQAARLFAGELQLHCARHLVMRVSRTIAPPGKRAGSYEPCTEAPSSWSQSSQAPYKSRPSRSPSPRAS